ncbi:rhomboid family intramembrane serine protease [Planctomycetota bacterium]
MYSPGANHDSFTTEHPITNWILLALNIIFFLIAPQYNFDPQRFISFIHQYGLRADSPGLTQYVTHMFIHGGFGHLFFNLLFLYWFGNYVNKILGDLHYFIVYVFLGFFAALGHVVLVDGITPLIGASGAIFGVTGMFLALRGKDWIRIRLPGLVVPLPAIIVVGFFFVRELLAVLNTPPEMMVIAHWVHIFGFIGGFSYIVYLEVGEFIERPQKDFLSFFWPPELEMELVSEEKATLILNQMEVLTQQRSQSPEQPSPPVMAPAAPAAFTGQEPPLQQSAVSTLPVQMKKVPPEVLIGDIETALQVKDKDTIILTLKSFERRFPGEFLPENLYQRIAEFYFQDGKHAEAINICKRIIRYYSDSPNIAYTYYVISLLYAGSVDSYYLAKANLEHCLRHSRDPELRKKARELKESLDSPNI